MKFDDTTMALFCLLVICVVCVIFQVDGVKDIALAISGGIVGFLRMSALSAPKTPDSSMTTTLSTSPAAEKKDPNA